MQRLTVLDAGFLEAEDSDRHVSFAIGAIAVLAGPMPAFDSLTTELAARIESVPQLRQVLRRKPLDLGAPRWVDDDIDISHHVRQAALPTPGDDGALFRWAADVMERRLDRDRPLWECWVVGGLAHDRWAILMKLHHSIADGVAATQVLGALCDGGGVASRFTPAAPPARRARPVLSLNLVDWLTAAWRASSGMTAAAAQVVQGAAELAGGLIRPVARSSLIGPISAMRRYSAVEASLSDVTRICDRFDVTVNDVALAAITDSFRRMLIRRGERPQWNSLRTLVPVSVRSDGAAGGSGNRVSMMLPFLPVDKADPVEQLRSVHARMARAKGSGQRQAGDILVAAANTLPFPVTAWTVRALTRLPQRGFVTLATNVPGPRKRTRIAGREILRLLPIPPLALQLRTGVAIVSYADQLTFGIVGDYDAAPDVDELARGIERAVGRLAALASTHWRTTPVGTLALVQGG